MPVHDLAISGRHVQVKDVRSFARETGARSNHSQAASDAMFPPGKSRDTQLVDGLILRDGDREIVVRRRGLNPRLSEGDRVKLDGREHEVLWSLNAPDTLGEKVRYWSLMLPLMLRSAISKAMGRGNGFS